MGNVVGAFQKIVLVKCLSRMMGNYHVRFLGGKGAEKPLPYPVQKNGYKNEKVNHIDLISDNHY